MKQYLLSVQFDYSQAPDEPELARQTDAKVDAVNEQLRAKGAWVFAGGLQPPELSTVVQVRDGESVMTDGPYAETKEHVGGFWVIKAQDLDEALAWAAQATAACRQPVEVRPFQDEPEP